MLNLSNDVCSPKLNWDCCTFQGRWLVSPLFSKLVKSIRKLNSCFNEDIKYLKNDILEKWWHFCKLFLITLTAAIDFKWYWQEYLAFLHYKNPHLVHYMKVIHSKVTRTMTKKCWAYLDVFSASCLQTHRDLSQSAGLLHHLLATSDIKTLAAVHCLGSQLQPKRDKSLKSSR